MPIFKASKVVPNADDNANELSFEGDPDLLPFDKREKILSSPWAHWVERQLRPKIDSALRRSITEEITNKFRTVVEVENEANQAQLAYEQERYKRLKEKSERELKQMELKLREQFERLTKKANEELEVMVHNLELELTESRSALEEWKAKAQALELHEESVLTSHKLELESKEQQWSLQRKSLRAEIARLREELMHYRTQGDAQATQQRPSTPSGSRLRPNSAPKPSSTVGSEATMVDSVEKEPEADPVVKDDRDASWAAWTTFGHSFFHSVEKEPEAHCGKSEIVPSVVEGIEGRKREADPVEKNDMDASWAAWTTFGHSFFHSVEKEPEAHCGKSEIVPSVMEGIEGRKGEAHCGESEAVSSVVEGIEGGKEEVVEESSVRREKSLDSVSSGGGENNFMLTAAAFFAVQCQQEVEPTTRQEPNATSGATEPDSISTAVSPSEKSRASNDGSKVIPPPTVWDLADMYGLSKANVVLKEESSTHASGKTHQAPDVAPSSSDPLEQSGASSARSVDVVVASGLDFSVAESLELEPQEPASSIAELEAQIAASNKRIKELEEEVKPDDDDISEENNESIEGPDDSGSLPGGFESDGDAV